MINDRHNENATSTMGYNIWQHSWYGVSTYIYIYIYKARTHSILGKDGQGLLSSIALGREW